MKRFNVHRTLFQCVNKNVLEEINRNKLTERIFGNARQSISCIIFFKLIDECGNGKMFDKSQMGTCIRSAAILTSLCQ